VDDLLVYAKKNGISTAIKLLRAQSRIASNSETKLWKTPLPLCDLLCLTGGNMGNTHFGGKSPEDCRFRVKNILSSLIQI